LSYNLKYFERNIKLNNLNDKIIIYPYAFSDKKQKVKISYDPIYSGCASIENLIFQIKEEIIETRRLDDFINKIKPEDISFIKIDVEDHEYKVLKETNEFLIN